jgi:hypothetical protein
MTSGVVEMAVDGCAYGIDRDAAHRLGADGCPPSVKAELGSRLAGTGGARRARLAVGGLVVLRG